jgi:6-pyruvoyltetrahydropterin/6-carboxytetrahydropterin synthase
VYNHESKCAHLHGHNYRITFHCEAQELDSIGRVIDFSVIKSALCQWLEDEWDHKTLIWHEDPWLPALKAIDPTVVSVPFNPTAENIAIHLTNVVAPQRLPEGIRLIRCVVEETRKCSATFEI